VWDYVNYGRMDMLGWVGVSGCCRRTVARPDNLTQASQSRLGETNRDSPKPSWAKGRPGDPLNFWASEHLAQARRVSPKQDPALALGSSFEPSPRRRGPAWARPFDLSEGLGKTGRCLVSWLLLDDWNLFGYDYCDEIHVHMYVYMHNGLLSMRDIIHEWWMMDIVGTWHVKWMSGLELK